MVGVYKESGRSFCTLTPPSAALYVMAGCMIKCEARTFMQTDSAYSVGLHGFVMWFHSMKPQNTIVMAMRAQLISNPNTSLWFIVSASIPRNVNRSLKATNQRMLLTQKNRKLMRATTNRKIKKTNRSIGVKPSTRSFGMVPWTSVSYTHLTLPTTPYV